MEKDLIEVHDHAGNKVMIPKSEAMRLHGMMENKKHFDPEHYLDKAREKMQESLFNLSKAVRSPSAPAPATDRSSDPRSAERPRQCA